MNLNRNDHFSRFKSERWTHDITQAGNAFVRKHRIRDERRITEAMGLWLAHAVVLHANACEKSDRWGIGLLYAEITNRRHRDIVRAHRGMPVLGDEMGRAVQGAFVRITGLPPHELHAVAYTNDTTDVIDLMNWRWRDEDNTVKAAQASWVSGEELFPPVEGAEWARYAVQAYRGEHPSASKEAAEILCPLVNP